MTEWQQALAQIDWVNLLALIWFLVCFNGYNRLAQIQSFKRPCLANVLHHHRVDWMERILLRDNRVADTSAIANLERSVAFFASSTLILLAGLLTLFGGSEQVIVQVADLPMVEPTSLVVWELKLLVMTGLFIYAFFKFTWSLRQYGFASVLVSSAPMVDETLEQGQRQNFVDRAATTVSMAANNFNVGLRSYYFSLALLSWLISPWVLILLSSGVVYILYRREFCSSTLKALLPDAEQLARIPTDYHRSMK